MNFLLKILQKFVRMVQIQYSSIGPDKWFGVDPATSLYLNQWWFAYWCIYASLGLNESTARFSFFPAMWPQWSHTLGSWIKHFIVCQFHTSSLIIFFTSHHVAILFALCSHMVTHIFQSLHVCAFCINNPFPKFVTRGILWVIGWDNQYCNQHLPPEQYSFDCKYIEDSQKSSWMTGITPVPFVRERF